MEEAEEKAIHPVNRALALFSTLFTFRKRSLTVNKQGSLC